MVMGSRTLMLLFLVSVHLRFAEPFSSYCFLLRRQHSPTETSCTVCRAAKGGAKGGGGFGAKAAPEKKPSQKALLRRTQKTYGGTSPQEIAKATQKRVEEGFRSLPPHLQMATQLYQHLQKWNTHVSRLSILQQAQLPQQDVEGAQRGKEELGRLYQEHNFTEDDLHNIFQRITWDSSADAKAARAITGEMPREIAERVDRACEVVAAAVRAEGPTGRCLDVGCGFGVLVPHLSNAGVSRKQITGVDLSTEMIRNAQELHPGVRFTAADFLKEFDDPFGFDAIIFCSALHDLPDPIGALEKASSLLRPNGKLVILHPQGASHVLKQVSQNPIMVKRGLPDTQELKSLHQSLQLVVSPATTGSTQESSEGYLAVLQKHS